MNPRPMKISILNYIRTRYLTITAGSTVLGSDLIQYWHPDTRTLKIQTKDSMRGKKKKDCSSTHNSSNFAKSLPCSLLSSLLSSHLLLHLHLPRLLRPPLPSMLSRVRSELRLLLDSSIPLDFSMTLTRSVSTAFVTSSSSMDVSPSLLSSETSSPVLEFTFPEPSTRLEPPLIPSLMDMLQSRQSPVQD
jgi:hypothetical protein